MTQLLNIIYALPAVIVAFTVHEYAHARVADALGDPTPRMMGRVTLDPFAHIDWIGMIMMLCVGFGWAKPVQVSTGRFKNPRRDAVLVAIAGPLSNLFLALLSGLLYVLLVRFSIPLGTAGVVAMKILAPFVTWNSVLFAFNILPVPPLDGYKVIRGWSRRPNSGYFRFMDKYSNIVLIVLIVTNIGSMLVSFISSLISIPMMTLAQFIL